jgi:hypothetical protein
MSTIQKFCKVCQDAGKSEAEYRSHFIRETRDPNSKIICPTLLAIECRYCFKRGHTVKYCSAFKNKTENNNKNNIDKNKIEKNNKLEKKIEKQTKQTNAFSCLYDSDNELEEVKFAPRSPSSSPPLRHEDFPQLCAPKHFQPIVSNYAFALNAVIHPEVEVQTQTQTQTQEKYVPKILPLPTYATKPMKSWADDSSDEDDDEEYINNLINKINLK